MISEQPVGPSRRIRKRTFLKILSPGRKIFGKAGAFRALAFGVSGTEIALLRESEVTKGRPPPRSFSPYYAKNEVFLYYCLKQPQKPRYYDNNLSEWFANQTTALLYHSDSRVSCGGFEPLLLKRIRFVPIHMSASTRTPMCLYIAWHIKECQGCYSVAFWERLPPQIPLIISM